MDKAMATQRLPTRDFWIARRVVRSGLNGQMIMAKQVRECL